MMPTIAELEKAKYEKIWAVPEYNDFSPGESFAKVFGELASPEKGESVLDIGCGMGKGGLALQEMYGVDPSFVDHVRVLPEELHGRFYQQPLWKPLPLRNPRYAYGFCCDVMEHLPQEYVMLVLENIRAACGHVFFSIANVGDGFGKGVAEELHLTIQPFEWWTERLRDMGEILHARDCYGQSLYYVRCR